MTPQRHTAVAEELLRRATPAASVSEARGAENSLNIVLEVEGLTDRELAERQLVATIALTHAQLGAVR